MRHPPHDAVLLGAREWPSYVARSYANAHLPVDDVVAFALAPAEVRFVRKAVVRRRRASDGHEWVQFLDVGIPPEVAVELGQRFAAEVRREEPPRGAISVRTKHHHHPVTIVDDDVLRVEFRSSMTRVSPGVGEAVRQIGRWATVADEVRSANGDRADWTGDPAGEDELRRLVASGRVIEATKLARELRGLSLTEARRYVRDLAGDDQVSKAHAEAPSRRG